jgi:hypothetical protein
MNPLLTNNNNNNNWTMRNSYQNIARKSVNKTRHNSISKRKKFILFIFLQKKNTPK